MDCLIPQSSVPVAMAIASNECTTNYFEKIAA